MNVHSGHRQRMRAKLDTHGAEIFDTYELLEMLLYSVIPQRDTNPIAKALLSRFGTLNGVFSAKPEQLATVVGVGIETAEFISLVGRLTESGQAMLSSMLGRKINNAREAGELLTHYFNDTDEYTVSLMLLDSNMSLVSIEDVYDCSYGSGAVVAKPFLKLAKDTHASVALIGHSHPHGPLFPMVSDVVTDELLRGEFERAGVDFAESFVITGNSFICSRSTLNVKLSESRDTTAFGKDREATVELKGGVAFSKAAEDFSRLLSGAVEAEHLKDISLRLARKLRGRGSLYTASFRSDRDFDGLTEKARRIIKLMGAICSRRVTDEFIVGKGYEQWEINRLLVGLFSDKPEEAVYLVCFDKNGKYLGCEYLGEGTVQASEVMPSRLIEKAAKRRARAVIVAHNHPKGSITPSVDDLHATAALNAVFGEVGIKMLGNFVVAGGRCRRVNENEK